jgi:hypothetical protein
MAGFTDIQFYVDDTDGRFSPSEYAQAYDMACDKYNTERNRNIYSAILLLNKEILRLATEYELKSDKTGIENTEYQSLKDILSSRTKQVDNLKEMLDDEDTFKIRGGFGLRARKTIIKGIND